MAVLKGYIKAEEANTILDLETFRLFSEVIREKVRDTLANEGYSYLVMNPRTALSNADDIYDEALAEAKYYDLDIRRVAKEVKNPLCILVVAIHPLEPIPDDFLAYMPYLKYKGYYNSRWIKSNGKITRLIACVIGEK